MGRYKPYPAYKDSGVEWLKEVPDEWEVLGGKRIFNQRRQPAEACDQQLAASQAYGVVPQTWLMEHNSQRVVQALKGTDSFRHVGINDFVISLRSFEGGIEHSAHEGCVSPAYTVLCAAKPIHPQYYKHLLKSAPLICALQSSTDSLRDGKSISYEQFSQLSLPLPHKEEQAQIAAFLDHETAKIDRLIEKQEKLIGLLQEKRQAVISHAVTKGLDPNAPMKDSGVEWLGEIPEHWVVKPLTHLVDDRRPIMYGIVLPGPNVEEGVPIVKGGDVKPGRLRLELLCKTTHEIEAGYERSRLRHNDIVYSIRGSIGDAELVPEEIEGANLTQDAARIAPAEGVCVNWLVHAVACKPVFEQLSSKSMGAAVKGINIRDLKKALIPCPSLQEQEHISQFIHDALQELDALKALAEKTILLMQERRTALISAAVTGKIDVREWQPEQTP